MNWGPLTEESTVALTWDTSFMMETVSGGEERERGEGRGERGRER